MEESIHCDRLPNGIWVLTEEIPFVRSSSVGIWVSVGSVHEPQELAGVCHALEHMLFKGTTTRSARDIAEALDTVGGQLNAFTDKEFTCYHAKVLAEHLPLAVDLLCDMLRNSLFRPADIRCEKRVIQEEIRQIEDEPDELVHDILLQRMWPNHPLGRPVIGTRRTVRSLSRDSLLGFLRQHYTANRLIVAAAGRVRHAEMLDRVHALLGDLPAADGPPLLAPPTVVPFRCRVTRETEQAHVCVGGPGYSQLDDERYPMAVLDVIVGANSSSRLFQQVREKRGLAYAIGSSAVSYGHAGAFTVYAGTSPDAADLVLSLVRQEFDRVLDDGVQPREVAQARSHLCGSLILALEGTGSRMTRIAKSFHYYRRVVPMEEVVRGIEEVSVESVNQVARAILPEAKTSVVVLGPPRSSLARRNVSMR